MIPCEVIIDLSSPVLDELLLLELCEVEPKNWDVKEDTGQMHGGVENHIF